MSFLTSQKFSLNLALKSLMQCACCCVLLPELMSGHLVSTEQTDGGQKSIVRLTLGLLPWSRLHQHCDHLEMHTHTETHLICPCTATGIVDTKVTDRQASVVHAGLPSVKNPVKQPLEYKMCL